MSMLFFLTAPLVVFLAFVAPLWLIFHYVTKWKRMKGGEVGAGMVAVDRAELERLRDSAERLERRLAALESILDTENPNWRAGK
jgi:phage shock protein B